MTPPTVDSTSATYSSGTLNVLSLGKPLKEQVSGGTPKWPLMLSLRKWALCGSMQALSWAAVPESQRVSRLY